MMIEFPKPGSFSSLTSSSPKIDSIPLGKVLRGLADRLALETPHSIDDTLELFLEEHERYADAQRIAALSSWSAVKAWAAERLPSIGMSYGFTNRINPGEVKENLDQRASLLLVEFAEFIGQASEGVRGEREEDSIQQLLKDGARENALRKRIVATDTQIEAECIALRKRVRLGFSPLF